MRSARRRPSLRFLCALANLIRSSRWNFKNGSTAATAEVAAGGAGRASRPGEDSGFPARSSADSDSRSFLLAAASRASWISATSSTHPISSGGTSAFLSMRLLAARRIDSHRLRHSSRARGIASACADRTRRTSSETTSPRAVDEEARRNWTSGWTTWSLSTTRRHCSLSRRLRSNCSDQRSEGRRRRSDSRRQSARTSARTAPATMVPATTLRVSLREPKK